MKANKVFAAVLLGLALVACGPKDVKLVGEGAKDLVPSKATVDSVSYLLGINFGTFIKGYNFGDVNYAQIEKGIKDFVNAEGNAQDEGFTDQFKIDPNLMNELFNGFLEKRQQLTLAVNKAKSQKFLDANKAKEGIEETASGLQYQIIATGSDVKPGPQDTVYVRYKGSLIDGTVFDQVEDDAEPIALQLNRVIPGWQEGIQLVGEGGKIKLFIPSELGYGERGTQGIEPNSVLLFDVEVVEVHPFVAPED